MSENETFDLCSAMISELDSDTFAFKCTRNCYWAISVSCGNAPSRFHTQPSTQASRSQIIFLWYLLSIPICIFIFLDTGNHHHHVTSFTRKNIALLRSINIILKRPPPSRHVAWKSWAVYKRERLGHY